MTCACTEPSEAILARFWAKVDASGDCWQWTGSNHGTGYGNFRVHQAHNQFAHRFAYMVLVGPIPSGLTIDHLCRNRGCVNPDHFELVSRGVNALRGYGQSAINARRTHCVAGHDLSIHAYPPPRRGRQCRLCHQARARQQQIRRRAAKNQEGPHVYAAA